MPDTLVGEAVGAIDGAPEDEIGAPVACAVASVDVGGPAVVVVEAVASGVGDVAALAIKAGRPAAGAPVAFVHVQLAGFRRGSEKNQQHSHGDSGGSKKLAV
ncbi:hypothetical protein M3J43_26250, partial [Escherichia coli]|nr:hypothetical protein [Escherichia coli]